jgi:intracellular septation protein A
MADEAKLKELQKNRQLSLRHLRRGTLIFGITAVALLVIQQLISIQLWIPFIILGVLSFTVIGDAINYFYCTRRIRKMQHDHAA